MVAKQQSDRVLILAPLGADAANIHGFLQRAGHTPSICRTLTDVEQGMQGECGAILLTEEALTHELRALLEKVFQEQPAWSDIPLMLIASAGSTNMGPAVAAVLRGPRRTVTLLERPLRSVTLLATLDTLLAARHRQYEIRDLLDERDALLSSLETRVAERTEALQRMVEEMESFSYSVSHDLRSPLRSLAGYAEALQEDYAKELPPGARSYCEKIIRAARRMDNLTQDVLAYTRVTRCDMEIASVDLDLLIAEVIEQYPALGASAGYIRIQSPLGCVKGHVPSLIQCFSNLLGNAVKFVPEGIKPCVQVRAVVRGTRRRVLMKDNGPGIDPADHARIFRMFERAAGKTVPGTGIGLAIVKKAVERMGGSVGVNSELGKGAEFWIELETATPPCVNVSAMKNLAAFWGAEPTVPGVMPVTAVP
ncbi:MAG: HAMP domain-containing sensor histidine kinase [Verrucomicrobiota bacterium]